MVGRGHGRCALLLWASSLTLITGQDEVVKGTAHLLWPIHLSSIALSSKDRTALEDPEMGEEMAKIGYERFQDYLKNILPKELKEDPDFAQEFKATDHSRVNLAFGQYQRRVYAETKGVSFEDLLMRGERATKRLDGVDYRWPELYNSSTFKKLRRHIIEHSRLFNKRVGHKDGSVAVGNRFRMLPWVEVFHRGDALRPFSRMDSAYLMARYFAKLQKGAIKLNFEDPRGINPPFGKTYSHAAYDGNLVLYPAWASHLITPNMYNDTVVCFCFLVYPPEGQRMDWNDDHSANFVYTKPIESPAAPPARKRRD